MEKKPVSVLLVGAGGYGGKIANDLLANAEGYGLALVGVADPALDSLPVKEEFTRRGVPLFASAEEFYAKNKAELALICTPIPFHEQHVLLALQNGSDVLCEKPIAALPAQALHMDSEARKAGRNLHIGFQLSYTPGVLEMKQDVLAGRFGKALNATALICWPRDAVYYARSWCARRYWKGLPTFDSIAMNACAHYLHLMYFLLGDAMDTSLRPDEAEALVCRANEIETFDTSFFRVKAGGAVLRFLATHATEEKIDPVIRFTFEKAVLTVRHSRDLDAICARFNDGTVKAYGAVLGHVYDKIPYVCDVVRGEKKPVCTVQTALPHLITVDAVDRLAPVQVLKGARTEKGGMHVEGLAEIMQKAFESDKMPWELDGRFDAPTLLKKEDFEGGEAL